MRVRLTGAGLVHETIRAVEKILWSDDLTSPENQPSPKNVFEFLTLFVCNSVKRFCLYRAESMFSCPRWLQGRRPLIRLMLVLAAVELGCVVYGVAWARNCRLSAEARFSERLGLDTEPVRVTRSGSGQQSLPVAPKVTAGVYVDEISDVSIRELSCRVGFSVWFCWPETASLTAEDLLEFTVLNGRVESSELEQQFVSAGQRYLRCRVLAELSVRWELDRFPLDRQQIVLAIEHSRLSASELRFAADTAGSRISSRVVVPMWEVIDYSVLDTSHAWQTGRGDPRRSSVEPVNWSQLRVVISLRPRGWGFHLKLFQCVYVAVAIAAVALLIPANCLDPRFGLGVGGLFAAVANSWMTSGLIPDTGLMTLADVVNGVSILTILVTVLESTLSLHLYETCGLRDLSRFLDKGCFLLLSVGYVVFQVSIVLASS
jgi:hypothetical protein